MLTAGLRGVGIGAVVKRTGSGPGFSRKDRQYSFSTTGPAGSHYPRQALGLTWGPRE